jgi:RNA polymerase sigma-70 factor (ECF subfamily)
MNPAFDVRTSKSLLEKLRVFEDRTSWAQFMSLYLPMMQAWGRRFGLQDNDVEELTSRLLAKLVNALPQLDYDPAKGSFRGWLMTITLREISNLAREKRRRLPGEVATGASAVLDMLFEHPDNVDDLVDSLHERSQGMLRSMQDAVNEVESEYQGEERKSWELFQRIFLSGQEIEPVAAEFGLSYHAAAMRVQRIKKKVRSRALELALRRGLTP